jgi:hypothetical protein
MVEWECKQRLLRNGAKLVVRSTGSKTPSDLIAFFPDKNEIWLIQVKKGENIPKKEETIKRRFKDLIELKGEYKVKPFLFAKKDKRYEFVELVFTSSEQK